MAHPQLAEAGDAFESDMDSAAAAIDALNLGDDEPDDGQRRSADDEDQSDGEDDDLDLSEDEDGKDDEPAHPAIEAPASLNAEEKAQFAQLPPEAQRLITEVENRRNGQVQQATTKASEAQRTAELRAAQADAQARAKYAQQLKTFADNLAPQRPDPQLANIDPAAFIAQTAQYEAAKAQHDEFVQQVQSMEEHAGAQLSDAEIQQRDAELMQIPEVQNPETRETFFKRAIDTGNMLGLDMSQIGHATAKELKALRDISDWREKADKYDTAMARQMQRVRQGKKLTPAKPNAAQPSSSEGRGLRNAKQRLSQSGDLRDAAAAIKALG